MPIVTTLKPQKNNKRVNVYLDGEFAFGIDLDNLVKYGIKIEKEFSKEQIDKIVNEAEFHKTYMKLLNYASLRPRSQKELISWMARKKVAKDLYEKLVKKLEKLGLVNDKAFALWWVESRLSFKPRGKKALTMELRQKGIDKKIIEELLSESDINELKIAKKLFEKNIYKWQRFDEQKAKQKAAAFLARKGFGWETIKNVVKYTQGE